MEVLAATIRIRNPDGFRACLECMVDLNARNIATAVGTFMVLSAPALVTFLIQPIFALPAFATFQTAAKTCGPAAAAVGTKLMRTELLSSAWTGFFAGCLHTLSGPYHLAALAPLSIGRPRMESAVVGALWGCGHDAGQLIFGLLFPLLKDRLHIEFIRTWGTRVVGLTLLVIGAMGIRDASEVPSPCVALENGEFDVSAYEAACSQALRNRVPRITEKLTRASSLVAIALGLGIIISQLFGFSLY